VDKLKSPFRKFYGRHQGFLVVKAKSSLRMFYVAIITW